LVSARALARRGHDVVLLEAGAEAGGVARPITLGGLRFSPGPRYVWGFGEGEPGRRILDALGVHVAFQPVGDDFEALAIGDAAFGTVCRATSPTAAEQALGRLGRSATVLARDAGFRRSGAAMLGTAMRAAELGLSERMELMKARWESVAALARRHGAARADLRRIAYAQGIFAESVEDLSAVVFAAARHHLRNEMHVPVGGVAALVDALVVAAREVCDLRTGVRVLRVTAGPQHLLHTTEGPVVADRVVAACSPGVVAQLTGTPQPFAKSHTMGAVCLEVTLTEQARQRLRLRNFTWYAHDGDVRFDTPSREPETLNFTSPTLNGGQAGSRQIVCAFYPTEASGDAERALAARQRLTTLLGRVTDGVGIGDCTVVGPDRWTREFGAFEGAIYGRRLTSASLQTSAMTALPAGWTLAHSGAGIPGVLGCLQMGHAASEEVVS
jgi:phytoene dehydrogenase-like protein